MSIKNPKTSRKCYLKQLIITFLFLQELLIWFFANQGDSQNTNCQTEYLTLLFRSQNKFINF